MFLCESVTEDVDDFFLVIGDGVTTKQTAFVFVFELHIAHIDVFEVDAFGPIEDVEADRDVGAVFLDGDGLDDGAFSSPRFHLEPDCIAYGELQDGLVEVEGQVMVLQGLDELLHLHVGDGDLVGIGVTVVIQMQAGLPVPVGLHNLFHSFLCGLYEHEVVEVATKPVDVLGGVIVFHVHVLRLVVCCGEGHVMERDVEPIGWKRCRIGCEELSLAVFLQHAFNPCGVQMAQDVP